MRQVFEALSDSSSVRAVLLSGAGPKAFTAGLDVQSAAKTGILAEIAENTTLDGARIATGVRRHLVEFQDCISSVEKCEKPVVCVMHGYTLGMGIDIAACADVRICSDDTSFAVKEVDIGLAADLGALTRLPKIVGNHSWIKDVCLSARIFKAEEALDVGFVSDVYQGKDKAVEAGLRWASMVAEKSPVAVQGTKELLNWSRDHNTQDGRRRFIDDTGYLCLRTIGLGYTRVWNSAALQSGDVSAALSANLQKRKPRFEKL